MNTAATITKIGTIELIMDVPIAKEAGAKKGRVFDCIDVTGDDGMPMRWWFIGDTGERCAAFKHECVFTKLPSRLKKSKNKKG